MALNEVIAAAMPALLADADTKKAVLEYIAALTEQVSGKPQPREVWRQASLDWRLTTLENNWGDFRTEAEPAFLVMVGKYDAESQTGIIYASAYKDKRSPEFLGILDIRVQARDYMDVVVECQRRWPEALREWQKVSNPLPEKGSV